MCSDSIWHDGTEVGPIRKVFRVQGKLVGFAGSLKLRPSLIRWLKHGGPVPPAGDVTLMILERGRLHVWRACDGYVAVGPQFAIGSGGAIARAAMMAGATCQRAVRIATEIDALSGGRVRTYRLEP